MENGRSVQLKKNFHKLAWYFRSWQIFFCKEPDVSVLGFVGQQVSVATSQLDKAFVPVKDTTDPATSKESSSAVLGVIRKPNKRPVTELP